MSITLMCAFDTFRMEEEQRRQDWSENQQYQQQSSYGSSGRGSTQSSSTGPPGDPMGYYATLGVSKDASVQEIQSAFRGLAMKWRMCYRLWMIVNVGVPLIEILASDEEHSAFFLLVCYSLFRS